MGSERNEFAAMVLAASVGARFFPLTSPSFPKHLLPVGGMPILTRLLINLVMSGFCTCVVAVAHGDRVTANLLRELEGCSQESSNVFMFRGMLKVTLHSLTEDCMGSAEALRQVEESHLIPDDTHLVLLPGDLVVLESVTLDRLVNSHRRGNLSGTIETACTMILANVGKQDENGIPLKESAKAKKNGFAREEEDIEYIALAMMTSNEGPRVVWKQSKIDVEEEAKLVGKSPRFVLPKNRLRRGEMTRLRRDWNDAHAYVLSPWVRRLCQSRTSLVSIQKDLVPLLVHHQLRGSISEGEFAVRSQIWNGSRVLRACHVSSYSFACRECVARAVDEKQAPFLPPKSQVNTKFNYIMLDRVKLGEKVQCKSSTIGRDCRLSTKCRLNNVVAMNKVTIGENSIIQNTILGEGCLIGENCNLNDCLIPPGQVVPSGTKEKGDSWVDHCNTLLGLVNDDSNALWVLS